MRSPNLSRYLRSGAVAGAASAFVFTAIHDVLISDIWFSLWPMVAAGALCGLCIGWTYGLLVGEPSLGSWLRYNLLYVAMFALLSAASVLAFEPITTVAALLAANEPPNELFGEAMPLTVVFTLAAAGVIGWLYGKSWRHYGAILLTCTVLVLLLGLNVSVIGLVDIPSGSVYLIAEMFGLIVALNLVYVAVFVALERKSLMGGSIASRQLDLDRASLPESALQPGGLRSDGAEQL